MKKQIVVVTLPNGFTTRFGSDTHDHALSIGQNVISVEKVTGTRRVTIAVYSIANIRCVELENPVVN